MRWINQLRGHSAVSSRGARFAQGVIYFVRSRSCDVPNRPPPLTISLALDRLLVLEAAGVHPLGR